MRYIQTTTGRNELNDDSSRLSSRDRQILILCERERSFAELIQLFPPKSLAATLESLLQAGCLSSQAEFAGLPGEGASVVGLSEAERFRVVIDMLTELAAELPFVSRFRVQLRIERASNFHEAGGLATDLNEMFTTLHLQPMDVNANLHKVRRLIAGRAQ